MKNALVDQGVQSTDLAVTDRVKIFSPGIDCRTGVPGVLLMPRIPELLMGALVKSPGQGWLILRIVVVIVLASPRNDMELEPRDNVAWVESRRD